MDSIVDSNLKSTHPTSYLHHNCSTHILNLPNETLSDIFKEAAMDSDIRMLAAKSMSQVSRRWRDITLHLPMLWSEIYIPWQARDGYANLLTVSVQRSRVHPLDIRIDAGCFDGHLLGHHLHIVTPEALRWRTFSYKHEARHNIQQVLSCLEYLQVPLLESFEVIISDQELFHTNDAFNQAVFKGGAPVLSQIRICGAVSTARCLPLSPVTSLHLETLYSIKPWELMEILRHMRKLVSLTLIGGIRDPAQLCFMTIEDGPIEMASLSLLSFTAQPSTFYRSLASILYATRCPDLNSLTISTTGCDSDPMEDMLYYDNGIRNKPPYPALRTLTVSAINCSEFARRFDFTDLPSLETVSFMECIFPMEFLRPRLSPEPGSKASNDIIWPLLRTIKLSNLGAEEFEGLRQVITHRQACRRPIEVVEIDPHSLKSFPEDVEWIKEQVIVRRGPRVVKPRMR